MWARRRGGRQPRVLRPASRACATPAIDQPRWEVRGAPGTRHWSCLLTIYLRYVTTNSNDTEMSAICKSSNTFNPNHGIHLIQSWFYIVFIVYFQWILTFSNDNDKVSNFFLLFKLMFSLSGLVTWLF